MSAFAALSGSFPKPVAPVVHETLEIHNEFMVAITVLFAVVFAIMVYSLAKHRKGAGHEAARLTGPRGAVQWLWTLVPFAILVFVDFALMGVPAVHALIDVDGARGKAGMAANTGNVPTRPSPASQPASPR